VREEVGRKEREKEEKERGKRGKRGEERHTKIQSTGGSLQWLQ